MLKRTLALRLREGAKEERVAEFQRVLADAPQHMPMVQTGWVGKNIISRRYPGWNLTWDTVFEDGDVVDAYMEHPYHREVIGPFFNRESPDGVIETWESVYFEPRRLVMNQPGIRDCIKRSLVIRVKDGTRPEHTDALENILAEMPRHIPSIINWGINRSVSIPQTPWTLVWEQEFQDLEGYRAYGAHPIHWGPVDTWFDHERPTHIVDTTFQVFYPTGSTILGWKP